MDFAETRFTGLLQDTIVQISRHSLSAGMLMLNRWIVIEDLFIYLFIAGTVLSIDPIYFSVSRS